ncbi:Hypothetical_protein [Hexamita inflata]|uniref:Hypothetical_protein n=1 Tax=Hexamita inflata TaxID=28002 RepID=A0AA86V206_9EUKA|nr:Hypothetical protein HINF_LOCUS60839 [Hexamita inflata]CAI9973196.1 Hypothetical protein HINF_LOCUS60841 [Hexamita inflata]CAI9973198.1 Hypothetical protein HINF_LOCUS60843 [Hexamita inflata]
MKLSVSKKLLIPQVLQPIWNSPKITITLNISDVFSASASDSQATAALDFSSLLGSDTTHCNECEVDAARVVFIIKRQTEEVKRLSGICLNVNEFNGNALQNQFETSRNNQLSIIHALDQSQNARQEATPDEIRQSTAEQAEKQASKIIQQIKEQNAVLKQLERRLAYITKCEYNDSQNIETIEANQGRLRDFLNSAADVYKMKQISRGKKDIPVVLRRNILFKAVCQQTE